MIVTKSTLSEEDNYLGYTDLWRSECGWHLRPDPLTRVAVRIDLVNISTRFAGTPFAGREVRIDAVGIYNVKTSLTISVRRIGGDRGSRCRAKFGRYLVRGSVGK